MATTYDVKAIQARLNELGIPGGDGKPLRVDGVFGPNTGAAVIAFKKGLGLRASDYVGPITWEALMGKPGESELPWVAELTRIIGLHERRNKTTLEKLWAATVGKLDPSATAWCGQLQAHIHKATLPGIVIPASFLSARAWANFGIPVEPQLGATLAFWRGSPSGWQGHVGTYLAETADAFKVGGGNQSDAVTGDAWIAKTRLIDSRWPADYPQSRKRIMQGRDGKLSVNEA